MADEFARNPQWDLRTRSTVLAFLGRTDEAIRAIIPRGAATEELKKLEMNEMALLAQLFARGGRRTTPIARWRSPFRSPRIRPAFSDTHHAQFSIGCAYALLGQPDKALEWITKAANEGYPSYSRFSTERDLAALKGQPGFEALLARLRKEHERWRASL